jgi:hypothetical protein
MKFNQKFIILNFAACLGLGHSSGASSHVISGVGDEVQESGVQDCLPEFLEFNELFCLSSFHNLTV